MTTQAITKPAHPHNVKVAVSIDLGAKNTGVITVTHKAGTTPSPSDCFAATIVMPTESDGLTYSSKNRTAVRHRLRGKKRFTMARRLLRLIIKDRLDSQQISLSNSAEKRLFEALFGLLKRRGFNRVDSESDLTVLESLDISIFANFPGLDEVFCESGFASSTALAEAWENLTQKPALRQRFLAVCPNNNDFKKYLKAQYPELNSVVTKYLDGLKAMRDDCNSIELQVTMGHKHRSKYLKEILIDMGKDSRLSPAIDAFGSLERLWCLVGNISNLQLRAHRWYFNAPEMLTGDRWEPAKLQATVARAFKYFHPASHEQALLANQLVSEIENAENIVEALCTIDPSRTIPPYEDQNNRRPPVDMTLWLNPQTLNKRYGKIWCSWADGLHQKDASLSDNLDIILVHPNRKSRLNTARDSGCTQQDYFFSYILQRTLDRNKKRDPYALRALASGVSSQVATRARQNLSLAIGTQHVDSFIAFASDYYAEVQSAKSGLWDQSPDSLLERSNIHPPMKKRILDLLVGNVFGMDSSFGKDFRLNLWQLPVKEKSRSTVKSTCAYIEEIRKEYGGEFNLAYQAVSNGLKYAKSEAITKDMKLVRSRVESMREFLIAHNFDQKTIDRICNPYSLAQLYTLMETERNGFSNTCISAHLENQWRMSGCDNDNLGAQCSRLPADSVRPFDGVLRKVLQRQAHELACLTMNQIQSKVCENNASIDLSIIVEENKFAFSASIAQIKKNNQSLKKAQLAQKRHEGSWADKTIRIKTASLGICPYTGLPLGEDAEIDHIIPRSLSIDLMETVFNSEANLIYVSRRGNQRKSNRRYSLSDLDKKYLRQRFGSDNLSDITAMIETTVARLDEKNSLSNFDLQTEQEQACVRHALFLDDSSQARTTVMLAMAATNRTRVNGTQAWLIRSFIRKLENMSAKWRQETGSTITFHSFRTSAQLGHSIREALGEVNPSFIKEEIQPVASHSVDAMCAYAAACSNRRDAEIIGGSPLFADIENIRDDASNPLIHMHPKQCSIIRVTSVDPAKKKDFASKAIFKEGLYAIHFLPIIKRGKEIFVGFTLANKDGKCSNCLPVTGKHPESFFDLVSPYFALKSNQSLNTQGFCCYQFDKQKIFELMNKKALHRTDLSEQEKISLTIFEGLMYFTERQPISKHLISADGKHFVDKKQISADKLASINCQIKSRNLPFAVSGSVQLPAWTAWNKLIEHKDLANKWLKDIKTLANKEHGSFDFEAWLAEYFNMNSGSRLHSAVKRVASLPVVCKTSGGFIVRRTSIHGTPVYQVCVINGNKFKGFPVNNGKIDWNQSNAMIFPELSSENLTSISMEETFKGDACPMEQWRQVFEDAQKQLSVSITPGSSNRRHLRVRLPFETFISWFPNVKNKTIFGLPSEINKKDAPDFQKVLPELAALLGSPRSNLFIEELGSLIQFRYIVTSSNAVMNEAYSKAYSA